MKVQSALRLAEQGFRVFPLSANSKIPPKDFAWKDLATTDPDTIRSWWKVDPLYNIGVAAGRGLVVVDADCKGDRPGMLSLDMLDMNGMPDTLRVSTPSGGVHVYLRSDRQHRNRVDTIPDLPGIDLRADGGYVVGPGSTVDGQPYAVIADEAIAPSPPWLDDMLAKQSDRHVARADGTPIELDLPENVAKAKVWLAEHAPEAVEGAGGNQATYWTAAELRAKGLSQQLALDLMLEHWNEQKAHPPWLPDDLATVVENAYRYGQGAPGYRTAAGEFEALAIDVGSPPRPANLQGADSLEPPKKLALVRASDFAPIEKPERQWFAKDLLPHRNVTILNGDGATGKSLLSMQLAFAAATNTRWLGIPVLNGPVLYFSAEDDADETHIRLKEIASGERVDLSTAHNLHIALMAGEDALLAVETTQGAVLKRTSLFKQLRQWMEQTRPVLLVLDNLADIFGGNENVKSLARQFIGMLRGLAIDFDCTVLLLAHPSLSGMSSGSGSSGNVAWNNSVRSRLYLQRDKDTEGVEIDPNRRFLETKKANYAGTGTQIDMRWENGRFVALDMPELDGVEGLEQAETKQAKARRVFVEMLTRFNSDKRVVSSSKGANYAPKMFTGHPRAEGVQQRFFEIAMNELFDEGVLKVEVIGPPSRQQQSLQFARAV